MARQRSGPDQIDLDLKYRLWYGASGQVDGFLPLYTICRRPPHPRLGGRRGFRVAANGEPAEPRDKRAKRVREAVARGPARSRAAIHFHLKEETVKQRARRLINLVFADRLKAAVMVMIRRELPRTTSRGFGLSLPQ